MRIGIREIASSVLVLYAGLKSTKGGSVCRNAYPKPNLFVALLIRNFKFSGGSITGNPRIINLDLAQFAGMPGTKGSSFAGVLTQNPIFLWLF